MSAAPPTFTARSTSIPLELTGLSRDYVQSHQAMWISYLKKTGLVAEPFDMVVERLQQFLLPCLNAATDHSSREIRHWNPDQASWE